MKENIKTLKLPKFPELFHANLEMQPWVKSGKRGKLKCLKVNDNLALTFH